MNVYLKEMQCLETLMLKKVIEIFGNENIRYYMNCGSVLGTIRHGGSIPWDMDVDLIVPQSDYNRMIDVLAKNLGDDFYYDYYSVNNNYHRFFVRVGITGCDTFNLHIDIFPLVGLPRGIENQVAFSKESDKLCKLFNYKQFNNRKTKNLINKFGRKFISAIIPYKSSELFDKFIKHCNEYDYDNSEYVMNPCGHYGLKNILPKVYFGNGIKMMYEGFEVVIPEFYDLYLRHYYNDYMKFPSEKEQHMWDSFSVEIQNDTAVKKLLNSD